MALRVHVQHNGADLPVLLFLHGIGECYDNPKSGPPNQANLMNQALPKHIGTVSHGHPLRSAFTFIAPQLPDRATPWAGVVADVRQILQQAGANGRKLYVVGFSKGGLGAFQIGQQLAANALVTIDAAPMGTTVQQLGILDSAPPFWAIHTIYDDQSDYYPICIFNTSLPAQVHAGLAHAPAQGGRWRTAVPAPNHLTPARRHTWIADEASVSPSIYEWLLQH